MTSNYRRDGGAFDAGRSSLEIHDTTGRGLDRRRFLKGAAAIGLSASGLARASDALAATASGMVHSAVQLGGPPPKTPARGGTLRIGYAGNGTNETYSPALADSAIDSLHVLSVFDGLTRGAPFHKTEPGLAVGWESNKDSTLWEIRLRHGVKWHDGKPFTADDVIYNLKLMGSPAHLGHPAVVNVKLRDVKKLSDTLVQVPLNMPVAQFPELFIFCNEGCMIQNGEKNPSTKPVGTGPFKLKSFTPGQRSVLVRNDDYWDSPRPYPDQLEIISIDDDTARLNALEAGEIDICSPLTPTQAAQGSTGSFDVLVGYAGVDAGFVMRVDAAPFNDARVRLAMKLLIDRPAMIESVWDGFAGVLNDIPGGSGLPFYDNSLPQHKQDIEQAKSLLKQAGKKDLRIVLQTTAGSGQQFTQAAAVFAQQASAAGVSVQIKVQPISNYFNPTVLFGKMPFAQTYWATPTLGFWFSQGLITGATVNETHWSTSPGAKQTNQLYNKAMGTSDKAEAQGYWNQMQKIQWSEGGYIFWAQNHNVDAISKKVAGVGGPGVGWLYPLADQAVWNWGLVKG
jgi:peptide/nickel transport system substrate-binding protein